MMKGRFAVAAVSAIAATGLGAGAAHAEGIGITGPQSDPSHGIRECLDLALANYEENKWSHPIDALGIYAEEVKECYSPTRYP